MRSIEFIAIFVAVMATAYFCALMLLKVPGIARTVDEEEQARFAAIDGIRGFLALSVFVHHFFVHRQFLETGVWMTPKNGFLEMAGAIPVQLFFIITGFLFWGRAIRGDGRIDVRSFAISRFFRIAPMYALVMLLAFGLAWAATGMSFQGDPGETYLAITRFLTFGAFRVEFFNGIDLMAITAGVAWTLVYEWGFYAALPLIAWFAKWPRFVFFAALFLLLLAIETQLPVSLAADGRSVVQYAALFLVGMVVAQIRSGYPNLEFPKQVWPSATMAILLAGAYFAVDFEPAAIGFIFLMPVLLGLAYGVDMFGLFSSRPARLLGAASYSIYLIHGPILYITTMGFELETPVAFVLAAAIPFFSILTFMAIERPMMRMGKRIANPLNRVN